jgi:hypothetical protein
LQVAPIYDMYLVSVRIAEVSAVIAVSIMPPLRWLALVCPPGGQAREIRHVHCGLARRQESDHAAVACTRGLPIERHVDVKTRELAIRRDPTGGLDLAIQCDHLTTSQTDSLEDGIIEPGGVL